MLHIILGSLENQHLAYCYSLVFFVIASYLLVSKELQVSVTRLFSHNLVTLCFKIVGLYTISSQHFLFPSCIITIELRD